MIFSRMFSFLYYLNWEKKKAYDELLFPGISFEILLLFPDSNVMISLFIHWNNKKGSILSTIEITFE